MTMFDPPHPGEILREEFLAPLGLNVARAAALLGVSRQSLHNITSEIHGLSPGMAARFEKEFGPEAGFWMRMHTAWRKSPARKNKRLDLVRETVPVSDQ